MSEETDLRYPIGRFTRPASLSPQERAAAVAAIGDTPAKLRAAVAGLNETQLDTPYRPGGWTVRQVVHHVPDSHLNAYVRCKLALTEEEPIVRPYVEKRWAEQPEARSAPVAVSLDLLAALHARWALVLADVDDSQWPRKMTNPETGTFTLEQLIALYAWHGRHHTAHITALRAREGWN